ncbi:hypothetical protein GCM10022223_43370 [Kineosporia mesophila]|uniref:Uncharacterized protein n=1 Tax=Kineosporia mesophila TaxID=566012 RepID=A0ABP7A0H2_9ACTN
MQSSKRVGSGLVIVLNDPRLGSSGANESRQEDVPRFRFFDERDGSTSEEVRDGRCAPPFGLVPGKRPFVEQGQ